MFNPLLPLLLKLMLTSFAEPSRTSQPPQVAALLGPHNNFICNAVVLAKGRLLTTADCLISLKNGTLRLGFPEDFRVVLNATDIQWFMEKASKKPTGDKIVEKLRTRNGEKYDNKYSNEVFSNKLNEDELDYMLKGLAAYDVVELRFARLLNVTRFTIHPRYRGEFRNDLAILEVSGSELFQERPLRLNRGSGFNRIVKVYGWGDIAVGSSKNMTYKMKTVEMFLLPPARCSEQVGGHFHPEQHICLLPKNNETICLGFAGAPIVLDGTLLGIVEFGNPKCPHNTPVVGIRLRPFAHFLGLNHADIILSTIISIFSKLYNQLFG